MRKSMVEGNPLKLILQFAIPLLLGNLFQQTYNVADAAIVGQTLGPAASVRLVVSSFWYWDFVLVQWQGLGYRLLSALAQMIQRGCRDLNSKVVFGHLLLQ